MLEYKESLGFSRNSYDYYLRDFCIYFSQNNYSQFTEETVLPWCVRRPTELPEGFRRRITPLREFSKYLCAIGETDYVVPTSVFPIIHREIPYIFTDQELRNLFAECDPNEGRELQRSDFNEKDGTLFVRKNKAHRERILPLSDDVADMCRNYLNETRSLFPETEYMFPSPDGDSYNRKWLSTTFRRLWKASNPDSKAKKVRVYLLRHRFATAVFMKWLDEKEDLYAKMPYLSAYMGHSHFEDTAYYIHLLPEKLLSSTTLDWSRFSSLIPEVEDDDG